MFSLKAKPEKRAPATKKAITLGDNHDYAQVVGFQNSANDGKKKTEVSRELLAFPRPAEKETIMDYIKDHTDGDVFPYVAVVGQEEEGKEARLSRLRAFVSPYGKSVKPEMRINGVVLDMLEGDLKIDELKAHVDNKLLGRNQKRQNKAFNITDTHTFNKPYIQIRRITGEYVPLLSGSSDYTDLSFSLYDGRLLENQVVAQSSKIPTSTNGVFELSCDYCIPTKDIREMSLKYELARPIMKEDFQWGAVSLTISICEAENPYVTPKVEAMAMVRMPYTNLEDRKTDPDHKNVTFTASHVSRFKSMYKSGDIADNDEPRVERLKKSSYSKSTIRGVKKSTEGPSHLGGLDGWSQLQDMRRPLVDEAIASLSVRSTDDVGEIPVETKSSWMANQEKLREQSKREMLMFKTRNLESSKKKVEEVISVTTPISDDEKEVAESDDDESEPEAMKLARKKKNNVGFQVQDV
jgi:hypothetical protein